MPTDVKDFEKVQQENRFYPEEVPVFKQEPLKSNFLLVSSPEPVGEGIITRISFKEGDLVCKWTGFHMKFQTLHSLQHTEDKIFVHDPYFCGKFLHSCDPNCELDMGAMEVNACKDIGPFEKLTLNYNKTEKLLYRDFHCNCGADGCMGWVGGYSVKS